MMTPLVSIAARGVRVVMRRPAASVWAVVAVAAALLGVAAADLASRRVAGWSRDLRAQASMVIYLDEGSTAERAAAIADRLLQTDGVAGAVVISASDANDRLRAALGRHDELLAGIDPAALPVSIEVTLAPGMADVVGQSALVSDLRATGGVEDIEITRDYTAPLGEALAGLQRLAWLLLVVVGSGAALLVAAAVRLRLLDSTGEHAALAWLGASPLFTRGPSVVAGAMIGVAGAGLALVAAAVVVPLFQIDVAASLGGAAAPAWPPIRAAGLMGAGAVLGLAGGFFASRSDE
jgi:cell division transport system permease protein